VFAYNTQLIVSITVRVIAVFWSLFLIKRIKDWRITLLTAMLSLMAVQQLLRLTEIRSELPGFIVSLLVLLVTVFVGKLILEHQRDEKNLRQLNETLEQKVAERTSALEASNLELKDVLAQVKTLSGMLPICASCKKIRDDEGYWEEVASYISKHLDVFFTHGLCPVCAKKALLELEEFKQQKHP
jgi:L-lactate permease